VDPILELTRDIGDFLFALLRVPLDYILSLCWSPSWHTEELDTALGESSSNTYISTSCVATLVKPYGAAQAPSRVENKRPGSVRSMTDNRRRTNQSTIGTAPSRLSSGERYSKSASTTSLPRYSTEASSQDPPRYSQTLPRHSRHQGWYPPASAHNNDNRNFLASNQELGVMSASTPDLGHASLGTAPEYHTPEWRTYPAFPSAYPPTPLPASTSLPTTMTGRSPDGVYYRPSDVAYPPIPEDPAVEEGFRESLGSQRESNPSSACSTSDDTTSQSGVYDHKDDGNVTQERDDDTSCNGSEDDSHTGLSEDNFNATLRTPYRSLPPTEDADSGVDSSVDSLTSALTTTDNTSSLRTRASSESLSSDSSSVAGQKRSYPAVHGKARTTRVSHSRNATLRGRPAPVPVRRDPLQSSASNTPDEDDSEYTDDSGVGAKRRRVLEPSQRAATVRPVARGTGNTHKATLPTRGASSARGRVVSRMMPRSRGRPVSAVSSSTIRGRGAAPVSRQASRGEAQGVFKISSTSSSQSGTLRGKAL
jgi:hypothetical protein